MSINVNKHFKNGFRVKWIQAKSLNNSILIIYLPTIFTSEFIFFLLNTSKRSLKMSVGLMILLEPQICTPN